MFAFRKLDNEFLDECAEKLVNKNSENKIAYINHDIDDAIKGGVLCEEDIPQHIREGLGYRKSKRIDTMVMSLIENGSESISMTEPCNSLCDELHSFLFKSVYTNPIAKGEEHKANSLIKSLYEYYYRPSLASWKYLPCIALRFSADS